MIRILSAQKMTNDSHCDAGYPLISGPSAVTHPGHIARMNVCSALPPIQHWNPNQPQATIALMMAGRFDPYTPYADRANTGKGMPYFVPGCEFSRMGTNTMIFPSRMVNSACPHVIPAAISP